MTTSFPRRIVRWAAVVAVSVSAFCVRSETVLKPGDALPTLRPTLFEGPLPALEGKVLLVDFWASWCGPCRRSFPELDKLQQQYKAQGLVVLAVSVDEDAAKMTKFLSEHPVTFAVVRDREQKYISQCGIGRMPTSVLVGRDGKVVALHSGFNGQETVDQLRGEIEGLLKVP